MPTIFDGVAANALSILSAARGFYNGIGLSPRARELNDTYLNQSKSGLNTILSLGVSQNATIESLQQKIKAIRASLPLSAISPDIVEAEGLDNGNVTLGSNGTNVDEEA